MNSTKAIHFKCSKGLIDELDKHRSRYISRTELLEVAIKRYLKFLRARGGS